MRQEKPTIAVDKEKIDAHTVTSIDNRSRIYIPKDYQKYVPEDEEISVVFVEGSVVVVSDSR